MAARDNPLPWPSVALGFAAMFVVMGVRTAFAVLYPAMVVDLGWTVAEVTGAFSAGLFVYGPAALVVGVLVDRFGCRATMLGGCACLIVGMTLVAVATEMWQFYLAFILVAGLGSAAAGFIPVIKLISLRAPSRFAAAFGIVSMGQGIGALVVSPAAQGIVDLAGWRAGAVAVAVLVALVLPLVALFAPGPEAPNERQRAGPTDRTAGVRSPDFAIFFVCNAALGYSVLLPTHQVAHLIEVGFSPIGAATAAGAWGALIAVGGIGGGWALERWGGTPTVALATIMFGMGTAALAFGTPAAAWLLIPFVIGGGTGRGMLGVALGSAQTRRFAGPRLGRITGLLDLGFGIGAFLGPWLTAIVHDARGSFGPGIVSAIVAGMIIGAAIILRDRRSGGTARPA